MTLTAHTEPLADTDEYLAKEAENNEDVKLLMSMPRRWSVYHSATCSRNRWYKAIQEPKKLVSMAHDSAQK